MKKKRTHIVITGPESSGKTTLSRHLARHFGSYWVPEFARPYLSGLGRAYQPSDLLAIARGQWLWERYALARSEEWLFSDTSLLVLKVWSDYRYGATDDWILEQLHRYPPAAYLLCTPDLPWVDDPLRENPDDRHVLFEIYERELRALGVPYRRVAGADPTDRFRMAVQAVEVLRR